MQYLSASEVMIHEEALYQVYVPLPLLSKVHTVFVFQAGLSQNLRSVPWFKDIDPNTFYPRCYNLGDVDEKAAFFGKINMRCRYP